MTQRYPDRTALMPGSFNPFTRGHASIVERGLALFDRIVIAIGHNASKEDEAAAVAARIADIQRLYKDEPRVKVTSFDGLVVDAAAQAGACALLKGVRSVADFEYERQMADVNRRLSGIETVLLYSLPEYSSISSSMVRELQRYGVDVSEFLPQ